MDGIKATTKPLFREMVISWCRSSDPVTCIIADGLMSFAIDVANEVGVPIISCRTVSPCCFLAYFSFAELIEAGEVPFKGNFSSLSVFFFLSSFAYFPRSMTELQMMIWIG